LAETDLFFYFFFLLYWPWKYYYSKRSTQRSRRTTPTSRPLFLSKPFIDATLVEGSFKKIVVLPKYVDVDEWLAVNGK
jgi:hypothetical protein